MKTISIKSAALAIAAPGLLLAMPASGAQGTQNSMTNAYGLAQSEAAIGSMEFEHKRGKKKGWHKRHHHNRHYNRGHRQVYYDEPVYRDTRIWRARDGRYYCRRRDGTTGTLVGAAVGGLIGHEVAGRNGDRTLGVILGAAGGAILGRSIDRSGSRCR